MWAETFKYLADQKVLLEGILLKPSMVTPGAESSKRASPDEVADYTLKLLRRRVPPAVPGAFHQSVADLISHTLLQFESSKRLPRQGADYGPKLLRRRVQPALPDAHLPSLSAFSAASQSATPLIRQSQSPPAARAALRHHDSRASCTSSMRKRDWGLS